MKRLCLLLSCFLILQMLCACGGSNQEVREPVRFYYCNKEISYNSPSGIIKSEIREGIKFQGDLSELLRVYLQGPATPYLQTLIPNDVEFVSCMMSDSCVSITFSNEFSKLTGVKLSTACSAILMTVHGYTGIQTIQIRAEGSQLDEKDEVVLTMDDIVLMDTMVMEE